LAEAGFKSSVGRVGSFYGNALAKTINGLYKIKIVHIRGHWKDFDDVEHATPTRGEWLNTHRLLQPIGYISPADYENLYYQQV